MITGIVNPVLEATILLQVMGAQGQVLDTRL